MKIVLRLIPWILLCLSTTAQDPPFHASLRDKINVPPNLDLADIRYSDIWAEGDVALIGQFGNNRVDLLDISDPDNIAVAGTYFSTLNESASDQDVKSGRVPLAPGTPLMFISLESGGSDGVEIVDISDPSSPQLLTRIDAEPGPYEFIHNTSYRDDGWLVLCDSSNPSLAIIDLRSYDPSSPPATITSWTYELTGLSFFVHDVTITNERLYVSGWDDMLVYDVSDLGNSAPSFLGGVRGLGSHAVWGTEDGSYVVTGEERSGGALRLYSVVEDGTGVTLEPRDSFVFPRDGLGQAYSVHNPLILGDRVYASSYQAGVYVLQIDRTNHTWERVASFDTSDAPTNGYGGCWGVYPGLGEDRVVLSDLEQGPHVVDFSALEIIWNAARPLTVSLSLPTTVSVDVNELGNRTVANVFLHTSVNGAPFTEAAMSFAGGNTWTGDLPAIGCNSRLDYYVRAEATNLESYFSPAQAPAEFHTTYAASALTEIFNDDFESDLGWTVMNSSNPSGPFQRGFVVGDGAQPDRGDPDAAGLRCYMTGLDGGGQTGALDLDGGTSRLVSPALDFSAGDGLIRYKRWLFCNDSNAERDTLLVEVSNNGGSSYTTVEAIELKAGGWIENVFRVSDHVVPTDSVVVRFTISDDPNNSTTEAGIDSFVASTFDCSPGPSAQATTYNGTGTNPTCYSFSSLPVLGSTWNTQIDSVANFTFVMGYSMSGSFLLSNGELLIDPTSNSILVDVRPATGSTTAHPLPIPGDPSILGNVGYFQGGTLSGAALLLCNGIEATVGF